MINEKEVQERINRRLSGLNASEKRRMLIRTAIHAERKVTPVKRKMTTALAFALVTVMLMASIAIADHLNLFGFFGKHDERYAALSPHATLNISEPALLEHEHLGSVTASIDSAYYDGLSLTLAYRIENPRFVEAYTPTEEELVSMQVDKPMFLALMENEPGVEIYKAYNEAVANETPFGYREYSVYPSDHMVTDDGVDIPPCSAMTEYDENGAYCEIREFETPLPEALNGRTELGVSIKMYQQETRVWFDGEECYVSYQRDEVGAMNATIPMTKDAVQQMAGEGIINGVKCGASAQVSAMAASITLTSEAAFSSFLADVPEGIDASDAWVEIIVMDEKGNKLRAQEGFGIDERTSATVPFDGTGELPKTLTLYVYSMWEGAESADLTMMDGIVLNVK